MDGLVVAVHVMMAQIDVVSVVVAMMLVMMAMMVVWSMVVVVVMTVVTVVSDMVMMVISSGVMEVILFGNFLSIRGNVLATHCHKFAGSEVHYGDLVTVWVTGAPKKSVGTIKS